MRAIIVKDQDLMDVNTDGNVLNEKCNAEYVPLYHSENEAESLLSESSLKLPKKRGRKPKPNKVKEKKPKKLRGKGINWLFVKKFKNAKEAEEAVRMENTWSIQANRHSEEGRKQVFRCNKVKNRGPQCVAQVLLLYDAFSDDVTLFRKEFEHDHHLIGIRSGHYGIDPETKKAIDELFSLHVTKPRIVYNHLIEKPGLKMPTMIQLNNYLNDLRRRKYGCAANAGKFKKWIAGHTEIPENEHEAFVVSYCVQESSPKMCYILSTKKLLEIASRSSVIHADASFKMKWQGFQLYIIGTSNVNGKFYPLCLAIASTNIADVFKTIFNGLKDGISSIFSCYFEPSVLVCNNDDINNAFIAAFGLTSQIRTCWTFVKNEIKATINQMEKNKQNSILEDIEHLHLATSREDFDIASELFLLKWEEEQDFTNYFREEWLVRHRNWYLGAINSVATNNAINEINNDISNRKIIYERLATKRFLVTTCDIVTEWSQDKKIPSFHTKHIELSDWAETHQWLKIDRKASMLHSEDNKSTYLVQSSKTPPISRTTYIQSNAIWKTFDEYKEIYFSHWKVTMIKDPEMWMDSKCTCPQFAVKNICEHVLGLAVQMKYAAIPIEATKAAPAVKEPIKVKEETSSGEATSNSSLSKDSSLKSKKIHTLAAEKRRIEKKLSLETARTKTLRKSRLRSEIESALRKEKSISKRNSSTWSDEDSDTEILKKRKKRKVQSVKASEKSVPTRNFSPFSSENQDSLSDVDWQNESSRDSETLKYNDSASCKKKKSKRMNQKRSKNKSNSMESTVDKPKYDNITSNSNQEDEFYYFGQSIAAQLRRLPLNIALDLQVLFQNELTKARTKCVLGENVVHSSTSLERNPLEDYDLTVLLPSKIESGDSD